MSEWVRCESCDRQTWGYSVSPHNKKVCKKCAPSVLENYHHEVKMCFKLTDFLGYLRESNSIPDVTYYDSMMDVRSFGEDGIDLDYVLRKVWERMPKELKIYFEKFEDLVK